MEKELADAKAGLSIHKCPGCGVGLCFEKNSLQKTTIPLTSREDVKKKEKDLLKALKANDDKENAKRRLELLSTPAVLSFTRSEEYDEYSKNEENEKIIFDTITLLKSVKIVDKPIYSHKALSLFRDLYSVGWSIEISSSFLESNELEIESLQSAIKSDKKTSFDLKRLLETYNKQRAILDEVHKRRTTLEDRLKTLELDTSKMMTSLDELASEKAKLLDSLSLVPKLDYSDIDDCVKRLNVLNQYNEMMKHKERVDKARLSAELLAKTVLQWSSLLEIAIEEHFSKLRSTVDTINDHLASLAMDLFSYPMTIQLSLHSIKTKGNKPPKNTVALEIIRRGCLVSKFEGSALSAGEKQQIILMLLLALGSTVGNDKIPILLLDEPMPRLDKYQRETALEVIRNISTRRTILITEHNTIDDEYDHVIAL
jgi:DNA repair exonuclease SbcCD ATPase subunit